MTKFCYKTFNLTYPINLSLKTIISSIIRKISIQNPKLFKTFLIYFNTLKFESIVSSVKYNYFQYVKTTIKILYKNPLNSAHKK